VDNAARVWGEEIHIHAVVGPLKVLRSLWRRQEKRVEGVFSRNRIGGVD
jgi:hypothetical protein